MARSLKQFFYGIFFLAFFVGIASGLYFLFLKPAASCTDGIQNQNELGIDCGGVCGNACFGSDFRNLEITRVHLLSLGTATSTPMRVTVIAEVRNPNEQLAVASFGYVVRVLGTGGEMLGETRRGSFLYEREVKWLTVPNLELASSGIPTRAEVRIDAIEWKNFRDFIKPLVDLQAVRTENLPEGLRASGQVVNRDTVLISVFLTALFYDQQGVLAGASTAELTGVFPEEARNFTILHPPIFGVDPGRTEVRVSALRGH